MKKSRLGLLGVWLILVFTLVSCASSGGGSGEDEAQAPDLAYEIVEKSKIPQKLAEKIQQEQKEKFGFSYRNGEEMYIAFGFGEQPTGGYSIQVVSVKDMGSKIVVEARLIPPQAGEVTPQSVSYPYLVLLTKDTGAEVQFRLKDVNS